jgi:hypothetical protein
MSYKENYHPPDEEPVEQPILPLEDESVVAPDEEPVEQPILPFEDELVIEPEIEEEPPEVYDKEIIYVSPSPGPNPLVLGLTIAFVFILGLAIGFIGRPVVIKDLPIEVVVTMVPNESQVVAQANTPAESSEAISEAESSPSDQANLSNSDSAAPAGQPTPTIMDFVLSDARHFQGEAAAPVTIVEFSDFN